MAGSSDISDGGLMKYAALALAAACLFLTSGCRAEKPLAEGSHPPVTLSSWVVSWDRERGMEEYEKQRISGMAFPFLPLILMKREISISLKIWKT